MKLWNVTTEELTTLVTHVSDTLYNGNIVFKRHPERDGRAVSFTLTVRTSKGPAGRRSNEGRKICACCWHGHRDVMVAIFGAHPDARLKTALADYRGQEDFENKFEDTGYVNVGTQCNPLRADHSCGCED